MTHRIPWIQAVVARLLIGTFIVSSPMWLPELIGGTQHQMFVLRVTLWVFTAIVLPIIAGLVLVIAWAGGRQ